MQIQESKGEAVTFTDDHHRGALMIQNAHRSKQARAVVAERRQQHHGAIRIQNAHRARQARSTVAQRRSEHKSAVRIQSIHRARSARREVAELRANIIPTGAEDAGATGPEAVIGSRTEICWLKPDGEEEWHAGTIKDYDPATGKHFVVYLDGLEEWYDFGMVRSKVDGDLYQPQPGGGGSGGGGGGGEDEMSSSSSSLPKPIRRFSTMQIGHDQLNGMRVEVCFGVDEVRACWRFWLVSAVFCLVACLFLHEAARS